MSRSHCSRKRTSLEIRSARPCVHARIRGTRTRINSLPVRADTALMTGSFSVPDTRQRLCS